MKLNSKVNAILDAGVIVIQENGLEGASMERIAEIARVSKATLYKYFPSKNHIQLELINSISQRMEGVAHFDFLDSLDPRIQLKNFIEQQLTIFMSEKMIRTFKILLCETSRSGLNGPKNLDLFKNKVYENIYHWLDSAQENGILDKSLNLEKSANFYIRLHHGYVAYPILLEELGPLSLNDINKITDDILYFFAKEIGI